MRIKRRSIKARHETKDLTRRLYELRRPLTIGSLGLLLMVGAWWGYRTVQGHTEEAAQVLLAEALAVASKPRAETGAEQEEETTAGPERALPLLAEIRQQYGSTRAAEHALLQIGHISYRLGNYEDALGAYQHYLEEYPRGWGVFLAGIGKAYTMEAHGEYTAAASIFRVLADRYEGESLSAEALMGLARCLEEAGARSEALSIYRQVVEQYGATRWSGTAEQRMAVLEREGVGKEG